MSRSITRALAAPAALAILLAGCAGSDEPAPEADAPSEQEAGDPTEAIEEDDGTFSLTDEPLFASTSTGAQITMTIGAQPDDNDEIAWLEQYREDAGGDPVTYILSDVDNRDGSDLVNMYNISVYDEEGLEWACGDAETFVNEAWEPVWLYGSTDKDEYESAAGEPMDYDEAEELSRRANEHEFSAGVSPFERAAMVSVCPSELPERATAVEVMPRGMVEEPVYAMPESYMGEDG